VLRREFEVAREATDRVVKPVLTGPYSLAQGSILEGGYKNRRELARAYAEVLAHEVAELVHAGAALIQVDEPYLLHHPEDAEVVREGLATLAAARGRAHLALYTFFGDALPLWDTLMEMPVDVVGLDLTYGPRLADRIASAGAPRTLVLGLVDGRNTKLETRDGMFPLLDRALKGLRGPVALGPSCGLELLPRTRARAKLENMVALAREYTGHNGRSR
jgi:5-methyltetrahydropteroyltriglutamate--homocysteine methyltransferase